MVSRLGRLLLCLIAILIYRVEYACNPTNIQEGPSCILVGLYAGHHAPTALNAGGNSNVHKLHGGETSVTIVGTITFNWAEEQCWYVVHVIL